MSESWNSIFPNSASYDYSQVPTEEPSADNLDGRRHTNSLLRPTPHSTIDVADSRSLLTSTSDESLELPRLNARHMVQIRESQVPLAEEHHDDDEPPSEALKRSKTMKDLVAHPNVCSSFVEKSWFQAISAVVIISNVITTIVEMDKPYTKSLFYWSDRAMLCFYIVELCTRVHFFRCLFFCGPLKSVCWNVLDIIVVVAGMLDLWIMPVLPAGGSDKSVQKILQLLRLLRLLRVFKIVRVFLDIDLSWTEAPAFQSFIGMVILVNSLLMGFEIDIPWHGWFYFEQVLLCIYVFELSVRLKNFGGFFFSCSNGDIVWNILDFFIVSSSVLDSWITPLAQVIMKSLAGRTQAKEEHGMSLGKVMLLMRMLRLMRILRLVKLVKSVRPLFVLVTGVLAALQGVAWVLVLTIVTLYAMGILATSLIGKRMAFPPDADLPEDVLKPFSTVPNSMFVLFRIMSGAASDTEIVAIDVLMENAPVIKLGFVFFMITSSWTLLSILTAVVSENMISSTGQQEEEIKMETAEEDRLEQVQKLKDIFESIDINDNGLVEPHEIEAFLSDKHNAVQTARRCRVPIRDVKEVLEIVSAAADGTAIDFEKFVEYLADVSNVVTEKSVMKLEARLAAVSNASRQHSDAFIKLHDMLVTLQQKSDGNDVVSKMETAVEACSSALQKQAEAVCKGQLKEVERFMHGLAEKTEACLSEIQQKNQGLSDIVSKALEQALPKLGVDKFSEMLEFQFHRMQHELLCNMTVQTFDISKVRDVPVSSTQRPLILDGAADGAAGPPSDVSASAAGPPEAITAKDDGQSGLVTEMARASGQQMELQMEARLLATEKYMHGMQEKTESMLRKSEGLLEKMNRTVDQGFSGLLAEKFSETLEAELRMMRQELLFCLGRLSPDISKVREITEGDDQLPPVAEAQTELAGISRGRSVQMDISSAQMEARLLATEESIHGLKQKTEAMLRKVEGLLEKVLDQGLSDLTGDQFPETLKRELHLMRQELLCSFGILKALGSLRMRHWITSDREGTSGS